MKLVMLFMQLQSTKKKGLNCLVEQIHVWLCELCSLDGLISPFFFFIFVVVLLLLFLLLLFLPKDINPWL